MSKRAEAEQWLRSIVRQHIGANIRRFTWATWLAEVRHNALGGVTYLLPCEGKVVDANDSFTLVKTGANSFCVVLSELLSLPVAIGDKVSLKFYKLRRFDGTAADGSEDPSTDGVRTISLTGAETLFPVKWEDRYLGINEKYAAAYRTIENRYLRDLIVQCEKMRVDGGLRRVVNILTDANPADLDFIDPPDAESGSTPPGLRLRVTTGRFAGTIEIYYDVADDYYGLKLLPSGGDAQPVVMTDICFDELGQVLLDTIDDGSWAKVDVTVLKAASKRPKTTRSVVVSATEVPHAS
jgi:hypothetical protein